MKKRVMAFLMIIAITLSVTVPAFATGFSDLQNHWSKTYMEDLVAKGYLSGYEDGTMRPDKNITACETLALLSRFYTLDQSTAALIYSDYGPYVEGLVSPSLSWAYDELSVCLASGIIKKTELEKLKLTDEISKELLALYLVRAMQLQLLADDMADVKLSFKDSSNISPDYVGSIAVLSAAGIVTGDTSNNFQPLFKVNRAVVATMISRSLEYLKSIGKTLTIEAYDGLTRGSGIITAISGGKLQLSGYDGLIKEYIISTSTKVSVNEAASTLSADYIGCYARVAHDKGVLTNISIESDATIKMVQGKILSVTTSGSTNSLLVANLKTGASERYVIPDGATITKGSSKEDFSKLVPKDYVTLKLKSNTVKEVVASNGSYEFTANIYEIAYGTSVTLKLKDSSNNIFCFSFPISKMPSITRGETEISIDRLKAGDLMTVSVEDCALTSIRAEGSLETVTGELSSIVISTSGTKWVIVTEAGKSVSLSVDENPGVYSGSTPILLSAIHTGDTVSVIVFGSTITDVYLINSASSTTKLLATALFVDASGKKITALSSAGKLVYVDTASTGSIISASTGKTLALSSLPVNASLVIYGTYSSSNTFAAKSIVVEN